MPSGPWTTAPLPGSRFAHAALLVAAIGCRGGRGGEALAEGERAGRAPNVGSAPASTVSPAVGAAGRAASAAAAEAALGVTDRGIFSDLDASVQIRLPADLDRRMTSAVVDRERALVVLYRRDPRAAGEPGWPVKVYPLGGATELAVGDHVLALRPGDRAELAPLLEAGRVRALERGQTAPPGDDDGDGIPDPLDVLIGGYKNVLNAAPYIGGYRLLDYPDGDVPREEGVCSDVIVRAVRNAGIDLQSALQREIRAAPRAFPMVKRPNAHIDHRRVKTLLPYFERRWDRRRAAADDAADPLRPGDVVFLDTFPSRPGPDHVGVVSDRRADSGLPLVINSWTDGFRTSEMDLFGFVPITHRFRYPSAR